MEIHRRDNYTLEFLQSLIENEIEESLNIEFKRGEALSKKDAAKKEISKDVSAFANSNGGIIIYGIEEKNHKAENFSFIDGTVFTKEWLEQIISSTINRPINGLKIFPIRNNSNIKESIYVVQIPSSLDAPHLSKDKRFYRRTNFETIMMEEYEIRESYGRRIKSILELAHYRIALYDETITDQKLKFSCEVSVANVGEVIEKEYKVNVYFINMVDHMSLDYNGFGSSRDYIYTRITNSKCKLSGTGSAIYPNEMLSVLNFDFSIPKTQLELALNQLEIQFTLFYPNGEASETIKFSDLKPLTTPED